MNPNPDPTSAASTKSIEQQRLLELIEYVQHAARMRLKVVSNVREHADFILFEHQAALYDNVALNQSGVDDEDELWLSVVRPHGPAPVPTVEDPWLAPWLLAGRTVTEEPHLASQVEGAVLIASGTHREADGPARDSTDRNKPTVEAAQPVDLVTYTFRDRVDEALRQYVEGPWRAWAKSEWRRQRCARLYAQLYNLEQKSSGSIVETPLELVWGVGMGLWQHDGVTVAYPLITRTVELTLNANTGAAEVRPRDSDAKLELDWYAAVAIAGVSPLERAAKEFFNKSSTTFSPFDPGTFEPVLMLAKTYLDPHGLYWPENTKPEDRSLPKPDKDLVVTNTWVLFVRPKSQDLVIQDLERLKAQAEKADDPSKLPEAVVAIVTAPSSDAEMVDLPVFRGVSATDPGGTSGGTKAIDLYFPKPFNDDQVKIVQLLEHYDGVVVQGPPGTGKTHTIANIICHWLATGRRILVTSMKDPALRVLRDELPVEVQPLAIALLASEQEGMRQFEHSIEKIAAEVQSLDSVATERAIVRLEESIDALHARLARTDTDIARWATMNLSRIRLDDEVVDPMDAAREVVEHETDYSVLPDHLAIASDCAPKFSDADIVALRQARRTLKTDIQYLLKHLPQIAEFPDVRLLLQVHQDLSRLEKLKAAAADGEVPQLADSSQETLARTRGLGDLIERIVRQRQELERASRSWARPLCDRLKDAAPDKQIKLLEALGQEMLKSMEVRQGYVERPVTVPADMELDDELLAAGWNLAAGKSAFGLAGLIGKSAQKTVLESVRVMSRSVREPEDWQHVVGYLSLQRSFREYAIRWNALAAELNLETVNGEQPQHGMQAAGHYEFYCNVKVLAVSEQNLRQEVAELFPGWAAAKSADRDDRTLEKVRQALEHHLTQNRLTDVWAVKERFQKVLEGCEGQVIHRIRGFLASTLGNPKVADAQMQAVWSELMAELTRVHGLTTPLHSVAEVTSRIEACGAPKYAQLLREPLTEEIDGLLPSNVRQIWRWRRLATHLEAIDAQEALKRLSKQRASLEADLAHAYQDIVVKRTWLKLWQKSSHEVRAALQAYLNAIKKLGKGTGKRAVRYRHDARDAATRANPAVPCWIMRHDRVSESLPPQFGCFDLVIIDEASQSDLSALPAMLRAKKLLIVGDEKQVSPEGIGMEEEKVKALMHRFLIKQVPIYRAQMSPERSIYDLAKTVFARSSAMLREHFRCVPPIIEYSKREFYNHELVPLRQPKTSERLDPPLIDVVVEDGYRRDDLNLPEARYIVDEIKRLACDSGLDEKTIGVVSLLGSTQASRIREMLTDELGPELCKRHAIRCGDAYSFQGDQRHIMFLSMVSAPNEVGAPLSRDTFAQRFNVAASRAKDRMYLVHSVELEHLSPADKLRRSLITHFSTPFEQDEQRVEDLRKRCESDFERDLYDELAKRGYHITPQVGDKRYRIDLVIEGNNGTRLAVECDGDRYHGPDRWADDMRRQRVLERAGWAFWRCFASAYLRKRKYVLDDLFATLSARGIEPSGARGAPPSVHVEHRRVKAIQDNNGSEDMA